MGYYTDFDIETKGDTDIKEIKKFLEDKSGYAFDLFNGGLSLFNAKWYDWEENIYDASKKFPNDLFIVRGDGEEEDDLWISYTMNGRREHIEAEIKITYAESELEAEFDANKVIHEVLTED